MLCLVTGLLFSGGSAAAAELGLWGSLIHGGKIMGDEDFCHIVESRAQSPIRPVGRHIAGTGWSTY